MPLGAPGKLLLGYMGLWDMGLPGGNPSCWWSCALLFVLVVSSKPSKADGNYPVRLPLVKGSKRSRGSAFPHPGAGLDAVQEEHRKTNKVVDPPESKEGDCPGVGIADCSWEQPLGTVPAPSWGTELLCTAVELVGGLSPSRVAHWLCTATAA